MMQRKEPRDWLWNSDESASETTIILHFQVFEWCAICPKHVRPKACWWWNCLDLDIHSRTPRPVSKSNFMLHASLILKVTCGFGFGQIECVTPKPGNKKMTGKLKKTLKKHNIDIASCCFSLHAISQTPTQEHDNLMKPNKKDSHKMKHPSWKELLFCCHHHLGFKCPLQTNPIAPHAGFGLQLGWLQWLAAKTSWGGGRSATAAGEYLLHCGTRTAEPVWPRMSTLPTATAAGELRQGFQRQRPNESCGACRTHHTPLVKLCPPIDPLVHKKPNSHTKSGATMTHILPCCCVCWLPGGITVMLVSVLAPCTGFNQAHLSVCKKLETKDRKKGNVNASP